MSLVFLTLPDISLKLCYQPYSFSIALAGVGQLGNLTLSTLLTNCKCYPCLTKNIWCVEFRV